MVNIRNRKELLQSANEAITKADYDAKKLVLLHTAVAVGLATVITILDFVLIRQIDTTGGLAGMGMRSVLETVQSLLNIAVLVLLPVWELGIIFAAIQIRRGNSCAPDTLLEGFRRFGPAMRLLLLEALLYAGVILACGYLGIMLYTMSPLSAPMLTALAPMAEQITTQAQMEALAADPVFLQQFMGYATTMFVVMAVVCCVGLFPVFYRLRMARYLVLDEPGMGALAAMSLSGRMMRGNKFELFKLDLRFWWFYLLQAVIIVLGLGTDLLAMAGITLPISADTAFWLFYGLYAAGQLVLFTFARAKVEVTYAAVYDSLCRPQISHAGTNTEQF